MVSRWIDAELAGLPCLEFLDAEGPRQAFEGVEPEHVDAVDAVMAERPVHARQRSSDVDAKLDISAEILGGPLLQ